MFKTNNKNRKCEMCLAVKGFVQKSHPTSAPAAHLYHANCQRLFSPIRNIRDAVPKIKLTDYQNSMTSLAQLVISQCNIDLVEPLSIRTANFVPNPVDCTICQPI